MSALRSLGSGAKQVGAAVVVFFGALLAWPIVSGLLAGILDSVGVVISASTYLAIGPVVAGVLALYTLAEVGS